MRALRSLLLLTPFLLAAECAGENDRAQSQATEKLVAEANAQIGMPAIPNFRERKILKDILELRDQEGLVTYTYVWSEMSAKLVFFCNSIGYGVPYSAQFTNPERYEIRGATLPQPEPNGIFSPGSSDATWVMCKSPTSDDVRPVYVEPRIVVSPFRLEQN